MNAPQLARVGVERPTERNVPLRGALLALTVLASVASVAALVSGLLSGRPLLLDVAVSLAFAAALLAAETRDRHRPRAAMGVSGESEAAQAPAATDAAASRAAGARGGATRVGRSRSLRAYPSTRFAIGAVGGLATALATFATPAARELEGWVVVAVGTGLLAAAGAAASAARYLANLEQERLPAAAALTRGARVLGWLLVVAAAALVAEALGVRQAAAVAHLGAVGVNLGVVLGLLVAGARGRAEAPAEPLDLGVFRLLGSRNNPLSSLLDVADRELGIDLRSSWALVVVRRSIEPLALTLAVGWWLSTGLTVVTVQEQAIVERLGVPLATPLPPGLHLTWPWPVDRVERMAVSAVDQIEVGHEGEEEESEGGGPEDVLWARQHEGAEYTLLLGDGRDLIAIDAVLHYRIRDLRAFRYALQSPRIALRAAAYRAVMRATAGRTLEQTLSENVAVLTSEMVAMVQADADALGLGVEVLSLAIGGMHPPVAVAADYQAVVSADLGRATAQVEARSEVELLLPAAHAASLSATSLATAEAVEVLAGAAGEAAAFRQLAQQERATPSQLRLRRRLESLTAGLSGRSYTVVDGRYLRDGGELWMMP